jgi:phage gp29-like protein
MAKNLLSSSFDRALSFFAKPKTTVPPADMTDGELSTVIPVRRRAILSGQGELPNLSVTTDVDRIQAAIRAAERGSTLLLFTLYRDMVLNYTHLQAEWAKRKMVVTGQTQEVIPYQKGNAQDEFAAEVIKQMIAKCDNWMDGLSHLLEATLYPVAVCEKIFRQPSSDDTLEIPVRWLLKELHPVNYLLLNFQAGYNVPGSILDQTIGYNEADYESDIRISSTLSNGIIDQSVKNSYQPDPARHIVHRGNFLSRSIRDNYGGQMRAILFWWLLATKGRDWWGIFMQKYGNPFLVGYVDTQDKNTVTVLQQNFAMATQIGGMVVNKNAKIEMEQAASGDASSSYRALKDACNEEVSKVVVGQVLSSVARNTGMGSGVANLHGEVREDIRQYDVRKLSETLTTQLFAYYLRINGIPGNPPTLTWGGKREGDAALQADTLAKLKTAGLQPTQGAITVLSERLGLELERAPEPKVAQPFEASHGN